MSKLPKIERCVCGDTPKPAVIGAYTYMKCSCGHIGSHALTVTGAIVNWNCEQRAAAMKAAKGAKRK